MKKIIIFTALFYVIYSILNACSNLREAKLQDYPEFEMNTEKYVISGPFSPTYGKNKYIVENQLLNEVYKMELKMKGSLTKTNKLYEEKNKGVRTIQTEEITSHIFHVFNFKDSTEYKVEGELTYHRTKEENSKSSYENRDLVSLIEFRISDNGNNIGKICIVPSQSDQVMVIPLEVILHDNEYHIEYQNMFNKVTVSFEKDFVLIALFGLKPKSKIITTKMKGDILINMDLSDDIKSDICSIYLMVEAVGTYLNF